MSRSSGLQETDQLLQALSSGERRNVLDHLRNQGEIGEDELVKQVVEESEELSKERFEIRLRHVHLPKLQNAGVVEYEEGKLAYNGGQLAKEMLGTLPADRNLSEFLSVLSVDERRGIVHHLREVEKISRTGLVCYLEENFDFDRREAGFALHHSHLPKLDQVDIIDYNEENGEVRYHENPIDGTNIVEATLEALSSYEEF